MNTKETRLAYINHPMTNPLYFDASSLFRDAIRLLEELDNRIEKKAQTAGISVPQTNFDIFIDTLKKGISTMSEEDFQKAIGVIKQSNVVRDNIPDIDTMTRDKFLRSLETNREQFKDVLIYYYMALNDPNTTEIDKRVAASLKDISFKGGRELILEEAERQRAVTQQALNKYGIINFFKSPNTPFLYKLVVGLGLGSSAFFLIAGTYKLVKYFTSKDEVKKEIDEETNKITITEEKNRPNWYEPFLDYLLSLTSFFAAYYFGKLTYKSAADETSTNFADGFLKVFEGTITNQDGLTKYLKDKVGNFNFLALGKLNNYKNEVTNNAKTLFENYRQTFIENKADNTLSLGFKLMYATIQNDPEVGPKVVSFFRDSINKPKEARPDLFHLISRIPPTRRHLIFPVIYNELLKYNSKDLLQIINPKNDFHRGYLVSLRVYENLNNKSLNRNIYILLPTPNNTLTFRKIKQSLSPTAVNKLREILVKTTQNKNSTVGQEVLHFLNEVVIGSDNGLTPNLLKKYSELDSVLSVLLLVNSKTEELPHIFQRLNEPR